MKKGCPISPELLRKLADWLEEGNSLPSVTRKVDRKASKQYGKAWMKQMARRVVNKVMFNQ